MSYFPSFWVELGPSKVSTTLVNVPHLTYQQFDPTKKKPTHINFLLLFIIKIFHYFLALLPTLATEKKICKLAPLC